MTNNNPMKRDDPFAPWNNPFGNCNNLKDERDKKYYKDNTSDNDCNKRSW